MAFEQQRAKRQRFGGRPIDALTAGDGLAPAVEEAIERAVQVEPRRQRRDSLANLFQCRELDTRPAAARVIGIAGSLKSRPAAVEPVGFVGAITLRRFELDRKSTRLNS